MKNVIIVGAGGFGREALCIIKAINKQCPTYNVVGFIDDNINALDDKKCDCSIIGTIAEWNDFDNYYFVMGITSPKGKEVMSDRLIAKGAKFITIIHPRAIIQDFAEIGTGCVIGQQADIGENVVIGNFVHIAGSMVGQDVILEDYVTTTGYANIARGHIGKRVFIGSHAVILKDVEEDAKVCVGSIVMKKVKAGSTVFGNPAVRIDK